ncbi:hypothetical protein [Polaromonas sp. JS666]|uniref:hypothetical protein n=1 Tax=Polaromonas sp. (strain JS666 / ATCC BAA-500) TaxID=296591 RepID=UPI0000464A6A|nr:hypothetical protein [Polaromonas sp. JS666]ABE45223.1 hypothetical protein Bpro_3312 [Polaromonas sp. JS666]
MTRPSPALDTPPPLALCLQGQARDWLRVALSQYVTNGLTVSLGLVLFMPAIFEAAGPAAASTAAVGVLVTSLRQAAARALA